MPAAGFSEMPPVSNTTPLPTKASGASPSAPPFQRMMTIFAGVSEPWLTHRSAFMPSSAMRSSSTTSTSTPSASRSLRRLANSVVVSTFAGSETRSRVKTTPPATASAVSTSALTSSGFDTISVTGA